MIKKLPLAARLVTTRGKHIGGLNISQKSVRMAFSMEWKGTEATIRIKPLAL